LAKLLLSLWNTTNAFSFRDCVQDLDGTRLALAVRVVTHFANHGEDDELIELGYKLRANYPRLLELGEAATQAKQDLQEKWRRADAQADEGGGITDAESS